MAYRLALVYDQSLNTMDYSAYSQDLGAGQGRSPNILLLTHTFGFPDGLAATIRARLLARALVEAGARVRVFCTRHGDTPPNVVNTESTGVYEGVEFRYTTGNTTRASSFLKRRVIDGRGLTSALSGILRMRQAGELDAVYLWSTASHWNLLSQVYVSFLHSLRLPTVLELNERPWSQSRRMTRIEGILSPLDGAAGVIAVSEYLEAWVHSEATRLGRRVPVLRVPILVDVEEARTATFTASREKPFALFVGLPGGGSLVRSHWYDLMAEAMRQVWREGRKCDLVIVDASRHQERNLWLAEPGTESEQSSVVWLGRLPRETLLGLYQRASVLLLPLDDDIESTARFPSRLGEYLASGTPVVASAVGELYRFLKDEDTAYLVPRGSPDAWGQRVLDVLKDPVTAREIGHRGRELAGREFDYRRYGEVLREWFTALVEGRYVS